MSEVSIMKKYYVIYQSKDIGYYETVRSVVCVIEDEEIAKDFCNKFKLNYIETTVGENDVPHWLTVKI